MEFLGGFSKAIADNRRFFTIAAISSYPLEAVEEALLRDDRFLKFAPHLNELLLEEIDWMWRLDDYVWECLSSIIGEYSCDDLRQETFRSVHIQIAYLYCDTMYLLDREPHSITQGDIAENLEAL